MKKFNKIFLLFTGILFLASCAEEERDPQIYLLKYPTVGSPTGTKSYILEESKAGNVMENYSWSEPISVSRRLSATPFSLVKRARTLPIRSTWW